LCCNGALHGSVTVRPEHVRLVRDLGLTIEKTDGHKFGFRQPCPLYQKDRCSAYPHHPPTCQEYRCALLQKYEDGEVTLEDSLTITATAKELLAGGAERLTVRAAASGESLRFELAQSWDGEHGLRGSGALRQANAEVVLRAAALDVHLKKHFRLPKNESDSAPAQ
jgi:Fe-S-cluster containining protein